ncbi:MAG: HD domain-containing protein, partial [Nitrospira sp.]
QESSLIGNMVHTSIFATEIGLAIGYGEDELAQLALGGLVHDIGMFRLPRPLVLRTGRWSSKQISIMQKHTQYGADAVKRAEPYAWLSDLILQEHERINGSGYPLGLKGMQIHEPAQVIGLADRFDALLRSRSWRKGMLPHEAVRVVLSTERHHFSTRVLKGFVRSITLYPPGTWVKLSTGAVGMVTSINPQHPLRPVVSLEKRGRRGDPQGYEDVVDLSLTPSLCINQAITPVQAYSTTTH